MTTLLLCLSLLIAAVQFSTVDSALPCDSPLRKDSPHRFTHCPSCTYGRWSRWTIAVSAPLRVDHTCDSGKAKKYERSKTAVPGSTCTPDTVKEYKYECKQLKIVIYFSTAWILIYTACANIVLRAFAIQFNSIQ